MTPLMSEPIPFFATFAGTRRFTSDEYQRLIDAPAQGAPGAQGRRTRTERRAGFQAE
jgi:hypothetical protein